MSGTIKLSYFNIQGLAESIRYMLAYTGADFEDNRISRDDWPALKEKLPFNKLPFVEVDGKMLNQSVSICRYIGQRYGLEHQDLWTRSLLEAFLDTLKDYQKTITDVFVQKTPEAQKAFEDASVEFFTYAETLVEQGYFYGSKATWVDVYFAGLMSSLDGYFSGILKPYKNLSALVEKIKSQDKISNYLKTRPAMDKPSV